MKTLIVYSSRTGNTRLVAEAIHEAMPGSELHPVESAPDPDGYAFVVVGFWVDKGRPDDKAAAYLRRVKGRTIGLFGTLGAYPDSDHARSCMAAALGLASGNDVAATFMCQGKVDPALVQAMSRNHPMTTERETRLAEASRHPNADDLARAKIIFASAGRRIAA